MLSKLYVRKAHISYHGSSSSSSSCVARLKLFKQLTGSSSSSKCWWIWMTSESSQASESSTKRPAEQAAHSSSSSSSPSSFQQSIDVWVCSRERGMTSRSDSSIATLLHDDMKLITDPWRASPRHWSHGHSSAADGSSILTGWWGPGKSQDDASTDFNKGSSFGRWGRTEWTSRQLWNRPLLPRDTPILAGTPLCTDPALRYWIKEVKLLDWLAVGIVQLWDIYLPSSYLVRLSWWFRLSPKKTTRV